MTSFFNDRNAHMIHTCAAFEVFRRIRIARAIAILPASNRCIEIYGGICRQHRARHSTCIIDAKRGEGTNGANQVAHGRHALVMGCARFADIGFFVLLGRLGYGNTSILFALRTEAFKARIFTVGIKLINKLLNTLCINDICINVTIERTFASDKHAITRFLTMIRLINLSLNLIFDGRNASSERSYENEKRNGKSHHAKHTEKYPPTSMVLMMGSYGAENHRKLLFLTIHYPPLSLLPMYTRIASVTISAALALSIAVPAIAASSTATVDTACMKTAVQTREQALQAALETFHTSATATYDKRETDLLAAWDMTDAADRKLAIKNAWKTFKQSAKAARKTLKESRRNAWKTFRTSAKLCKGGTTTEETGVEAAENAI